MESRNASFVEDVFPCKSKEESGSSKHNVETIDENSQDQNKDSKVKPKHRKRERIEKSFGPYFITYMPKGEPQPYKEAVDESKNHLFLSPFFKNAPKFLFCRNLKEISRIQQKNE